MYGSGSRIRLIRPACPLVQVALDEINTQLEELEDELKKAKSKKEDTSG